jgi:hypothetical protein
MSLRAIEFDCCVAIENRPRIAIEKDDNVGIGV